MAMSFVWSERPHQWFTSSRHPSHFKNLNSYFIIFIVGSLPLAPWIIFDQLWLLNPGYNQPLHVSNTIDCVSNKKFGTRNTIASNMENTGSHSLRLKEAITIHSEKGINAFINDIALIYVPNYHIKGFF